MLSERLDPGPERRCSFGLVGAAADDAEATCVGNQAQLFARARLTDAGLAGQHHHEPRPTVGFVQRRPQHRHLGVPADECHGGLPRCRSSRGGRVGELHPPQNIAEARLRAKRLEHGIVVRHEGRMPLLVTLLQHLERLVHEIQSAVDPAKE